MRVVTVQVVDWATLNARAEKPELWEIASTGFVFSADPANHVAFRCTFWGTWCNEDKERLVADLRAESDPKKRKAIVERLQAIFYDDVGHVKLGDYSGTPGSIAEQRGRCGICGVAYQRAEESCPHGPARAATVWLKPPPFTVSARRMLASWPP